MRRERKRFSRTPNFLTLNLCLIEKHRTGVAIVFFNEDYFCVMKNHLELLKYTHIYFLVKILNLLHCAAPPPLKAGLVPQKERDSRPGDGAFSGVERGFSLVTFS